MHTLSYPQAYAQGGRDATACNMTLRPARNADGPRTIHPRPVACGFCDPTAIGDSGTSALPILRICAAKSNLPGRKPIAVSRACRESIGAETGVPHRKRLFRALLTPCIPVEMGYRPKHHRAGSLSTPGRSRRERGRIMSEVHGW